jgi:hypothetical protein
MVAGGGLPGTLATPPAAAAAVRGRNHAPAADPFMMHENTRPGTRSQDGYPASRMLGSAHGECSSVSTFW